MWHAHPARDSRAGRPCHLVQLHQLGSFALQSDLYRKDRPASSVNFFNKFADSLMKLVASAPERGELFALASGNHRIVDTPMQAICRAGKDGTSLVGVITDSNHIIEFIIEKFVRRL